MFSFYISLFDFEIDKIGIYLKNVLVQLERTINLL